MGRLARGLRLSGKKEREFYGIYFNEYRSLKNGQGEELEALPDYLEEKPSFDRKV